MKTNRNPLRDNIYSRKCIAVDGKIKNKNVTGNKEKDAQAMSYKNTYTG